MNNRDFDVLGLVVRKKGIVSNEKSQLGEEKD